MIINKPNFQAAFINTMDVPKSTKHICYYTSNDPLSNNISCFEVYEAYYPHPEAPDYADIPITLIRRIESKSRFGSNAGHLVLLEAIQNDCHQIYNK